MSSSSIDVSRVDTPAQDKSVWWLTVAIIVFYLVLYLLPLGARPLIVPDETRYAEIPREILATGDWVVPRYDGLRYFEKPPLGYWLNAASLAVFGENEFAARLPSALAAGLTSLLIFLFAHHTLRSRRLAVYAALIHQSFLEVYAVGTVNVLDNFLALFLSSGILAFYLAAQATQRRQALMYWVASGVCLGLALLAKGFLALAIPVIVLVPWMLWQGQWRKLFSYGWLVIGVAVLVAMPWALLIHARESDFWHYFFWVEHVQRFTAEDAQHKAPFYYFLAYLPLLAFPWLALMPAAVSGFKMRIAQSGDTPLFRFLWLWLLVPFLFFSVSSGKLATYILPCFPPLAVLMAVGLHRYLQCSQRQLFNGGLLVNGVITAAALTLLLAAQNLDIGQVAYEPEETLKFYSMVMALLIVLLGGWLAFKSRMVEVRLAGIALGMLPVFLIAHFAYPDQIATKKSPTRLVEQYASQIPADAVIIADSYNVGAVAWVLKRQDIYLSNPGELWYGVRYPDVKPNRYITDATFTDFLEQNRQTHTVAMFCTEGCRTDLLRLFPADAVQYSYGIFDLWIFPKLVTTDGPHADE